MTIKCDVCGKFVGFQDIYDGKAARRMMTPDSDCSSEEWETLCPKHNTPENRHE